MTHVVQCGRCGEATSDFNTNRLGDREVRFCRDVAACHARAPEGRWATLAEREPELAR
jgi:hypothetical protein